MSKTENPLNVMLQDVLDGVEHFFGKDGLEQIANFAVMKNRSRESNRVMDELERLYGAPPEECSCVGAVIGSHDSSCPLASDQRGCE